MIPSEDIDELKQKALCADCVGETFLRNEIDRKGERRECSYCHSTRESFLIEEISEKVDQAFNDHFSRTQTEPDGFESALSRDRESAYEWEREGEETVSAIGEAASISEAVAHDIQRVLEDKYADFDTAAMGDETEFDAEAHYAKKSSSDDDWQTEWRTFANSLKSEARFFNQTGARHLTSIFKDIEALETRQKGRVVVDAGPGASITGFYRARVFHTLNAVEEALISPDRNIGPPPSALARAGRMNAHGISVFYGADDPGAALAEIRPPVGSWAVVARFEIIRTLRLLDLTALVDIETKGSVFDPQYKDRLGRAKFLGNLSQRLTSPVMPDDEPFEYLTTQAVADFLATDPHMSIDGILFPSVQVAGSAGNVVLFHKASSVERIKLPEGTKVTAHSGYSTEDGCEFDFSVWEEAPKHLSAKKKKRADSFGHLADFPKLSILSNQSKPKHPESLRIDLSSVKVHEIKAVSFKTDVYPVTRHRYIAQDEIF